jgi:uncharacterized protein YqjF (DUF2071 family)
MFMRWHDLLFAHWPIPVERLRPYVPHGLEIETFDGSAWLGVVPFRMSGVRHRLAPPVPGLSAFPEINVRTYVHPLSDPSRPGVWFFSLDASNRSAVRAARALFNLPYMDAAMECRRSGDSIHYRSRRIGPYDSLVCGRSRSRDAEFRGEYRPTGPVFDARPGSLEYFLTHRFCLYAQRRDSLIRLDIDHAPWPLQPARWSPDLNTMAAPLGLGAPDLAAAPLLHFSERIDVVAWLPRAVARAAPIDKAPAHAP